MKSKLILGTAQFTGNYGVTNEVQTIFDSDIQAMLSVALHHGISWFDCAQSYGLVLDRILKILRNDGTSSVWSGTTKVHLQSRSAHEMSQIILMNVKKLSSLNASLVFIHDIEDFTNQDFANLKTCLDDFQLSVSASVYDLRTIEKFHEWNIRLECIQIPLSILNQAFVPYLESIKMISNQVWGRSIFLQGVVDLDNPRNPFLQHPDVKRLRLLESQLKADLFHISVSFVLNHGLDLVVGFSTSDQMRKVISYFRSPLPFNDYSIFASFDQELVDPRRWKC